MVSYEVISPILPDIFAELGRLDTRAVARATEHHPSGTRHRLAVGVKKKAAEPGGNSLGDGLLGYSKMLAMGFSRQLMGFSMV